MAAGDLDRDGRISFDEFMKVRMLLTRGSCMRTLQLLIKKIPGNTLPLSLHQHDVPLRFAESHSGFLKIHCVFAGFPWPEKHRCG